MTKEAPPSTALLVALPDLPLTPDEAAELRGKTPREIAIAIRQRQLELDYGTQDVTHAAQKLGVEAVDIAGEIMRDPGNGPRIRLHAAQLVIAATRNPPKSEGENAQDMTQEQLDDAVMQIHAKRAQKRLGARGK